VGIKKRIPNVSEKIQSDGKENLLATRNVSASM
jgi:hypothetical protein